jgi:lipopolysaccharide export system protein LptA
MTLDADDLEVALKTHNAQMVGHVKGHFSKTADSEDITVESDKATYNQTTNQIDLSGNVKVTIYSLYTDGPLVQTGDSATVQLGAAPTYPLITMNHVHATFTPGH